ncbi:MAG: hypothetical protein LC778_08305 [Acidobacteria bacterium]|nr:hypothetical protein [Acidobacteriota bacterium]
MNILTPEELHACGVRTLGLDPEACDLLSIEAIAAALRRAAGFLCPCPQRTLVQAIVEPLEKVVGDKEQFCEAVENTLEAMITYGDLLEESEVTAAEHSRPSALLYAAPPSFIWRDSGAVFLIGITPDHASALPERLTARIDYGNHVRRLFPESSENLRADLNQFGLTELSMDAWHKETPPHESSSEHLQRLNSKLNPSRGSIDGLKILNPAKPVTYYRGRWEEAKVQTGRFMARRPQAYGNDVWCYVELVQGKAVRLIDFPTTNSRLRGCDEAWRLQLAIDAERGESQRFRVRHETHSSVVEFYSPLPMWATRRWDDMGEPITTTRGLFAYKFSADEISEEIKFMQQELWIEQVI